MSDVMLFGVLRMPYEMAMGDELSRYQFWQRVQEAADRLEAAEKKIAELEHATPPSPSTAGREGGLLSKPESAETRMDTGLQGGLLPGATPPSTTSEVGELPPLPSLPETLQSAMVDYRLAPQNDRASKAAVILAIQAYAESYARAALAAKPAAREVGVLPPLQRLTVEEITIAAVKALTTVVHPGCTPKESHLLNSGFLNGVKFAAEHASRSGLLKDAANEAQPSSGEVDVEAERKLFEVWWKTRIQQDQTSAHAEAFGFEIWLAARRTQVPAQTGSGEEGKATPEAFTVLEDVFANSEAFYKVRVKIDGCNNVTIQYEDMDEVWLDELRAALAATQSEEQRG